MVVAGKPGKVDRPHAPALSRHSADTAESHHQCRKRTATGSGPVYRGLRWHGVPAVRPNHEPAAATFLWPTTVRAETGSHWARGLLDADNVKIFLATVAASVKRFRELDTAKPQHLDRYEFNPLFQCPLVEVPGSGYIAPIPDLLIWRIEDAPYWELRKKFHGDGKANQFATFFGKELFERYVGLQLATHFGNEQVIAEQIYRGPAGEKAGPDSIVKIGTFGFALECTIGSLPMAARSGFDAAALRTALLERYVARLNALPQKLSELSAARPDLDLGSVSEWHYALVYRDPIGPPAKKIIGEHVNPAIGLYHLLSLEELEDLATVGKAVGLKALLLEKESTAELQRQEFRQFLGRVAVRESVDFANSLVTSASRDLYDRLGIPD